MSLISYSKITDGSTVDASDVNSPLDTIYNDYNGNIDGNNITQNLVLNNLTVSGSLSVGSQTPSADWTPIATPPTTVTYNGQRSYDLVFNTVDYANILSPGMRIKTTRTVASPTQCTSLNGTTQYWSKTSPNKLTFTDDFVVDAYVKLTSYAICGIVSRINGTQGWKLGINADGTIEMGGYNGALANASLVKSYQSIPLNKWVRITAQLDMSTFTATTTTSYIMIDGVDVPCVVLRGGTNPTALVQAGNLEIGSYNAGGFFPGKIAQVAVFNAKVTQATMLTYMSQGLSGTETSLASAYSFNGVATDLNTTTPNDLTAQGSAVATNADSPFGTQASGLISSTIDYGIVQKATFSTNTTAVVQVPEGCTIPTSGGVSSVSYSSMKAPYGFPSDNSKWLMSVIANSIYGKFNPTLGVWYGGTNALTTAGANKIIAPVGKWKIIAQGTLQTTKSTGGDNGVKVVLSTDGTNVNSETPQPVFLYSPAAGTYYAPYNISANLTMAAATTLYLLVGGYPSADAVASSYSGIISIENAYL